MGMPHIPEETYRPNKHEVVIDLLKSIVMEETAISHILNAEAEKIQAFVGKGLDFPNASSHHEILRFNTQVFKMIDVIVMKEWLLLRKLENVMELEHGECHDHCECDCEE